VFGNFRGVWTWALRAAAVFFLCLVTASSLSLFTRASNLTNRGIVSWGPYRFIRHPDYLARNMFWLITIIPSLIPNPANVYFSWRNYVIYVGCALCGLAAWATIYFLRAATEEQFLRRDPEYLAYCQRVKYRFIPRVY
jgi:protein-S-isoprenylcysteine O-methyltransferase Ste14